MDLLFKRYASPFLFVDGMIQTGCFSEFVDSFVQTVNEEKNEKSMWEYFLHKTFSFEGSYNDFKALAEQDRKNQEMPKETIETVVHNSLNILKQFKPSEQEVNE